VSRVRTAESWPRLRLGDVLKIKHGFAFKSAYFADAGDLIVLTPGNFEKQGGIKLRDSREKYYVGAIPDEFLLHRGDLLVVMTDLTQEAPILGSPAFIPEDNRFLHNQRLGKVVQLDENALDMHFLFHLLNLAEVRAQIKGSATGTTVRHTAPERIYAVNVRLPSVDIQRKIAAILSAYDDLIENNTRRIAILEEMARALYREWFVDFRYPGHQDVPLVESPLGQIPQGWEVTSLIEVCSRIGSGGTPSRGRDDLWNPDTVNWFKTKELRDNFLFESEERISDAGLAGSSAKIFPANTVVMAIYAAPTVGRLGILTRPSAFNQAMVGLIGDPYVIGTCYLFHGLLGSRDYFNRLAQGAAQQNISVEKVRAAPALIPPRDLMNSFEALSGEFLSEIRVLTEANTNLRTTRDFLLPKLVSGEVDVSELDIALPPVED